MTWVSVPNAPCMLLALFSAPRLAVDDGWKGRVMSIVVIATLTPLPEHRDAAAGALCNAAPLLHAEPGCELYELHGGKINFVLVEQWADSASLKTHSTGEAFVASITLTD